jgi:hypothetical protein
MAEENHRRKLTEQIQSLRSNNKNAILGTLSELRSEGTVSILPELFQLLLVQEDVEIQAEIAKLLNDLKDQEAAEVLARSIANPEYKPIRHTLVAACWQNGLSYGKYLEVFTEVLISDEYPAALEAFTVLEGAIGEAEASGRARMAGRLKSKLETVGEQKKGLLTAMLDTLESY